ncbi:MAG: hypothetical protein JXA92_06650 [candidate division Zixibacteria bacterium]|nr:hypothetical protein [candidate division Zixibacteria bacterium]
MKKFLISVLLLFFTPAITLAGIANFFEQPDTLLASNIVIDVIEHNGGVWFATGEGVNFSYDDGLTWLLYDETNGLVSEDLSSIYSINGRIWVATNHDSLGSDDTRYISSDGLSYSDDNGDNWIHLNFGPSGLDIPFTTGVGTNIYDIAGHVDMDRDMDWLFFTAYYGGLLASQDGGINWRRLYPTRHDSLVYDSLVKGYSASITESMRYFSCAADTSHGDSLFLWSGTAGGIWQYVFAKPSQKLYARYINRIAFCDTCTGSENNYMFVGGDRGVVRGRKTGGPWITRFVEDGLPGSFVTALIDFRGRLLVGTLDTLTGYSAGLAYSTDMGESFDADLGFIDIVGDGRAVTDFAVMGERLYMAAEEAGLYVSLDSGQSWENILIDSLAVDSPINYVNALFATGDTLWVGTDDGFVSLVMDGTGVIDSLYHSQFAESDTSSSRIIRLKVQQYGLSTTETVDDSTAIWTIHRPLTGLGIPFVGRSTDGGQSWRYYQKQSVAFDVNFIGDTAFVVGEDGVRVTTSGSNPAMNVYIRNKNGTDSFDNDTVTFMTRIEDTLVFGASRGLALSRVGFGVQVFDIYRGNVDSLAKDFSINYTAINTLFPVFDTLIDTLVDPPETTLVLIDIDTGLTGDFIQALGVQYPDEGLARIWASGNRTDTGFAGIAVGQYIPRLDELDDTIGYNLRWHALNYDNFAWNFAFFGDTVFAATDAGLLIHEYTDVDNRSWDTLAFVDSLGRTLLDPGKEVYGVEVIDSFLWVGTTEGSVRINLNTGSQLYVGIVDSTSEVYAFPVPFSPLRGEKVKFHFEVKKAAYVTVEVYDFAMNLVRRPVDRVWYEAGYFPDVREGRNPTWDGYNGRGDRVAVGMYYFKVEFSTGEVQWGKLAVIP